MKAIKLIFNRITILAAIILVEIIWILTVLFKMSDFSIEITVALNIISALVVLWIINKEDNPAYKIAWIISILIFPIFGGLLYLAMGNKKPSKKLRKKLDRIYAKTNKYLVQNKDIIKEIENLDERVAGQVKYLSNAANYPIYKNSKIDYYSIGEDTFKVLIEELKKAKHYIFMEYFIIEKGRVWNTILEILQEKAKAGLDVRLIYDDFGCLALLPYGYDKELEKIGIKCIPFNPVIPILSVAMNNRDHRKITVIDGHTAFTGGINLADEYINEKERFGHWKDTGVMIKGEAAWSFTVMFLQMWNGLRPTDISLNKFMPKVHHEEEFISDGYVQPYCDTPLDEEIIGENVYINILNQARKYVYIFTPYLIIDNEMITALTLAAKRGVDVRLVTPGIPDKKIVYKVTQSYYLQLLKAGVRIYQYTPGFIHAKSYVCDDEIATVGTINMDYRSLYLHFECGVYLYKSSVISDIKKDAIETMRRSREVTLEDCNVGLVTGVFRAVMRAFAPLM